MALVPGSGIFFLFLIEVLGQRETDTDRDGQDEQVDTISDTSGLATCMKWGLGGRSCFDG